MRESIIVAHAFRRGIKNGINNIKTHKFHSLPRSFRSGEESGGEASGGRCAFLVPQINLGATILELFLFPTSKDVGMETDKSGGYEKVSRLLPFRLDNGGIVSHD